MSLKEFSNAYNGRLTGKSSFLHKNPKILKETKKLLKEAEDINMNDTAVAIYMVQNIPELKSHSHNTVRKWFKDVRLGLYE
tara:strand:+ start:265 stop:507 length:243 start_codon:yes stop_codon:yes gene_type:complete